ncbi:MAG: hypothetical protein LLF86_03035 [Nitrospiraceae bacterium]|nr:hypothetical protein [Nitrospiraceae bacterium]
MRRLLAILIPAVFFAVSAESYEVKGLQPLAPYGVFSTFSTETLKENKFDAGFAFEKVNGPDFYRTNFQFAYGLKNNIELSAALPYVLDWQDRVDGFEDFAFGFKHRIFDGNAALPSVAYLLTVSGYLGKDEFTTEGRIGGGLILTKKVGPFKGHLNLLYFKPVKQGLHDEYALNTGAELAVSSRSTVLVELIGKKEFDKNKINMVEWRLGYRAQAADNIFTTIGAGFDIKNRTPDFRLMFSINFILPTEKIRIHKVIEE